MSVLDITSEEGEGMAPHVIGRFTRHVVLEQVTVSTLFHPLLGEL